MLEFYVYVCLIVDDGLKCCFEIRVLIFIEYDDDVGCCVVNLKLMW